MTDRAVIGHAELGRRRWPDDPPEPCRGILRVFGQTEAHVLTACDGPDCWFEIAFKRDPEPDPDAAPEGPRKPEWTEF